MITNLADYLLAVNEELSDLTNGVFDLSMLTDYSDGEYCLSQMFSYDKLTPREAARRKMYAEGYEEALNCWSTECDFCEWGDVCPHIS